MNKTKLLTTIGKVLSVLVGLAAYSDLIPEKFAIPAAIAFAVLSTLKDLVKTIGDYIDDGVKNDSFKVE